LNNVIIKVVGEHENHAGNPRSESVRKFDENLKQETAHNHTNPHNIWTQNDTGVPDEVRVILPTNANLKQDIRRWRQDDNLTTIPIDKNFKSIPDKYQKPMRGTGFLRKDTGPPHLYL
ncbi:unnamed protein product, partial [Didymodactylos carnosus]